MIDRTPHHDAGTWTFLTNHAHVAICLHADPHIRLRDVAVRVGITERAVQRIVADLEEAGVITRRRAGRRNVYEVDLDQPLRHSVECHRAVGDLLRMVAARRSPTEHPHPSDGTPTTLG